MNAKGRHTCCSLQIPRYSLQGKTCQSTWVKNIFSFYSTNICVAKYIAEIHHLANQKGFTRASCVTVYKVSLLAT